MWVWTSYKYSSSQITYSVLIPRRTATEYLMPQSVREMFLSKVISCAITVTTDEGGGGNDEIIPVTASLVLRQI